MADIVTAITTAVEISKRILELGTIAKDAQAKLLIADLQLELANVRSNLAALIEENTSLKSSLKDASSATPKVLLLEGMYYKANGGDGPFCTACFDSIGKLVLLTKMGAVFHDIGKWKCNVCKGHYGGI